MSGPRHVVVTGAAGAIGSAIARELRATWPTVRLALVDRKLGTMLALAAELGEANVSLHAADLRDLSALPALVEHIAAAGPLEREGTLARSAAEGRCGPLEREGTLARSAAEGRCGSLEREGTLARSAAEGRCGSLEREGTLARSAAEGRCGSLEREGTLARSAAEGRCGSIDGLVNCAGVMQVQQLASWDWADAEALLAIDLLAPLRLQALIARAIVDRGGGGGGDAWRGTIINVSSMAGRVPLRGCAYYGASKAGLAMASEIARADLAEHGIRVVTVYPGPVKSALEQGARDAYGGGGLVGRLAPTGDPAELARRTIAAVIADEPRVIYPRAYGVGWTAPNLSSWLALSYGPPPMH